MIRTEEVVGTIEAALEREARVNVHSYPIEVRYADGIVTLSGEVGGIAAKKIALELAAAPTPVAGVIDRLRVEPSERMEDGAIRDHVCNALVGEPAFNSYSVQVLVKQQMEPVRSLELNAMQEIESVRALALNRMLEVEVSDGVVVLNGTAESISHKRLAGVLAWWVPGSRDVVNGIELSPAMEDNDDEVVDALRLVLEKDPLVNASQIKLRSRDCVVTLEGAVPTENSRMAAEADAWYIFGVSNVVNKLMVIG